MLWLINYLIWTKISQTITLLIMIKSTTMALILWLILSSKVVDKCLLRRTSPRSLHSGVNNKKDQVISKALCKVLGISIAMKVAKIRIRIAMKSDTKLILYLLIQSRILLLKYLDLIAWLIQITIASRCQVLKLKMRLIINNLLIPILIRLIIL